MTRTEIKEMRNIQTESSMARARVEIETGLKVTRLTRIGYHVWIVETEDGQQYTVKW